MNMKVKLVNTDTNNVVADFNMNVGDGVFSIIPIIHDETFSYLLDDLKFFRMKWLTRYLSEITKDIENEMYNDFMDMMEDNIKYYNLVYGTYKLIKE